MLTATRGPVVTAPATWHAAIAAFKRALIERALADAGGNRTGPPGPWVCSAPICCG
jgi:hypothetical protein